MSGAGLTHEQFVHDVWAAAVAWARTKTSETGPTEALTGPLTASRRPGGPGDLDCLPSLQLPGELLRGEGSFAWDWLMI